MASFIYLKAYEGFKNGSIDWDTDVFRALLERDTSTYTPNIDHDFLDDFTTGGGVEISVASYARQTLTNNAVAIDTANDRVEADTDNLAFGNLESGQTVKAVIIYRQVGGSDATPANDELIAYIDGTVDVILAANALSGATTIYVDPLKADLPASTSLDFGGGATGTTSSAASRGDRSLALSGGGLGAGASAGATDSDVSASVNLPVALGGGAFNVTINAEGLFHSVPKKG